MEHTESPYYIPNLQPVSATASLDDWLDRCDQYCIRSELEIKHSRFLASLGHAPDRESARAFVAAIKIEFPDATHNCWAYNAGRPGDTALIGQSDDGEPHGTAGKPILNQILHSSVGEVVAVITRYFGGIKLGTGGLARAYQTSCAEALALLPVIQKVEYASLTVGLDYAAANRLYQILPQFQAQILAEEHATDALFDLRLPRPQVQAFIKALQNATDGQAFVIAEE